MSLDELYCTKLPLFYSFLSSDPDVLLSLSSDLPFETFEILHY